MSTPIDPSVQKSIAFHEQARLFEAKEKLFKAEQNLKTGMQKRKEGVKALGEFVGYFYSFMLQKMHNTVPKEGLMSGGRGEEIFQQQMDMEMGRQMALEKSHLPYRTDINENFESKERMPLRPLNVPEHMVSKKGLKMVEVGNDRDVNPLTRKLAKGLLQRLDNFIEVTKDHIVETKNQIAEIEKNLADKNIVSQENVENLKAPFGERANSQIIDDFKKIDEMNSQMKVKVDNLREDIAGRVPVKMGLLKD